MLHPQHRTIVQLHVKKIDRQAWHPKTDLFFLLYKHDHLSGVVFYSTANFRLQQNSVQSYNNAVEQASQPVSGTPLTQIGGQNQEICFAGVLWQGKDGLGVLTDQSHLNC